jgi:glutathione peroxidase
VTVLGFPCNQFGAQEPGSAAEIRTFVSDNYDIDFPMFSKIEVNGEGAAALYQWLKEQQPGDGDSSDIAWNFEKFLVNRDGEVVARFAPTVTPEEVAAQLPELLG